MRRRRTRRRKAKRNKQIIIISTMCLLFCLCAGYAAFQTNISITAKGNAFCSGQDATDKIIADSFVESGSGLSGLYEDSYETGRYVYRGSDVDNYITFDGETWRIIAIESNGTLKIMKNDFSDETMVFESPGYRSGGYCSEGSASTYGCNVWAATENMVGGITSFVNGSYEGEVTADSYLNTYLNDTYYNDYLSEEAQSLIVDYTYNIGAVAYSGAVNSTSYTIADQLEDEDDYKWIGKVALINLSDYIRSNSSTSNYCDRAYGIRNNYTTCAESTWMYISGTSWWTITPYGSDTGTVWYISFDRYISNTGTRNARGVRPVVHLKANLKLCGSGTSEDPYTIVG